MHRVYQGNAVKERQADYTLAILVVSNLDRMLKWCVPDGASPGCVRFITFILRYTIPTRYRLRETVLVRPCQDAHEYTPMLQPESLK